jgi:hypothetical protein
MLYNSLAVSCSQDPFGVKQRTATRWRVGGVIEQHLPRPLLWRGDNSTDDTIVNVTAAAAVKT